MVDMVHEVIIGADPEKVYAAITEQQGLASWWTDKNTASPEVGSEADFVFEGGQIVFKMKIDELTPASALCGRRLHLRSQAGQERRLPGTSLQKILGRRCYLAIGAGPRPTAHFPASTSLGPVTW